MREISRLVVHCSASPDALDIGFKEIDEWHKARHFNAPSGIHCGYHYIIRRSGVCEVGRMDFEVGAHVEGFNQDSIGVCLVGTHEFAPEQISTIKRVLDGLQGEYPNAKIYEHRQFPTATIQGKTCPNLSISATLHVTLGTL